MTLNVSEQVADPVAVEVQSALGRGDAQLAVTRAVEGYGPEVLGFLVALLRDADAADDVFSQFCEDVWRGLSGFRGHSTLRAWMYAVARNAAARYLRARYRQRRRPLSWAPLAELEARVRTQTLPYLRTESRSAVDRLREQLTPDERALLILRLDRGLAWNEVAAILTDGDAPMDAEQLRKATISLRKRFERVKDKLRKLAQDAGLLDER